MLVSTNTEYLPILDIRLSIVDVLYKHSYITEKKYIHDLYGVLYSIFPWGPIPHIPINLSLSQYNILNISVANQQLVANATANALVQYTLTFLNDNDHN